MNPDVWTKFSKALAGSCILEGHGSLASDWHRLIFTVDSAPVTPTSQFGYHHEPMDQTCVIPE